MSTTSIPRFVPVTTVPEVVAAAAVRSKRAAATRMPAVSAGAPVITAFDAATDGTTGVRGGATGGRRRGRGGRRRCAELADGLVVGVADERGHGVAAREVEVQAVGVDE